MKNDFNQVGLERFITAQDSAYPDALEEIKKGRKMSHWMWYIFPQIKGLGHSPTTTYYSIKDLAEAQAFMSHPLLGPRLVEISNEVLNVPNKTANEIFGSPDDKKLRSCMTLFSCLEDPNPVFELVLKKYFKGLKDEKTVLLVNTAS